MLNIFAFFSPFNSEEKSPFFLKRYPFNWKTPIGYFFAYLIQTSTVFAGTAIFVCALISNIGFCTFGISFVEDIEECLQHLNDQVVSLQDKELSHGESIEMKTNLATIIQLHADAKELSIVQMCHFHGYRQKIKTIIYTFVCQFFLRIF